MTTNNCDSLIFGVRGQDGSFLAEQLLADGQFVVGVARRASSYSNNNIAHILEHKNFRLVEGDITDQSSIMYLLQEWGPKYIYNLAAQSHVQTSFSQPLITMDVTALGHIKLLEAVRILGTDCKIYFAASSEMFGDQYSIEPHNSRLIGVDMTGTPVYELSNGKFITTDHLHQFQDENTKMNPQSPYGIAKLAAYQANKLYRQSYNLFTCSGILFNHESQRRPDRFVTRKITRWLGKYLMDHKIPKLKLGNLAASRDWGYAGDYTRVMKIMMQNPVPDDYVVGTGTTHTVYDFLCDTFALVGIEQEEINRLVESTDDLKRPSEVPYLCASPLKAQNLFNLDLSNSYTYMVEQMVEHDCALAQKEAKV